MPRQVTVCEPCEFCLKFVGYWCHHFRNAPDKPYRQICEGGEEPIQPSWCPLLASKPLSEEVKRVVRELVKNALAWRRLYRGPYHTFTFVDRERYSVAINSAKTAVRAAREKQ